MTNLIANAIRNQQPLPTKSWIQSVNEFDVIFNIQPVFKWMQISQLNILNAVPDQCRFVQHFLFLILFLSNFPFSCVLFYYYFAHSMCNNTYSIWIESKSTVALHLEWMNKRKPFITCVSVHTMREKSHYDGTNQSTDEWTNMSFVRMTLLCNCTCPMWKMIMIVKWNINIWIGNGVLAIILYTIRYTERMKKKWHEVIFNMPKIN